jgi:hypothetical protein
VSSGSVPMIHNGEANMTDLIHANVWFRPWSRLRDPAPVVMVGSRGQRQWGAPVEPSRKEQVKNPIDKKR